MLLHPPPPSFVPPPLFLFSPLSFTGAYSLSIRDWDDNKGDHVKHYKIRKLDNGGYYITTRSQFDTVPQLVQHYTGKAHNHTHRETNSSSFFLLVLQSENMLCCYFLMHLQAPKLLHLWISSKISKSKSLFPTARENLYLIQSLLNSYCN